MHTVDCFVCLGGDLNNQTPLFGVTVAEVAILKMIHGQHAVTGVRLAGTSDTTMEDEYRRLLNKYPGKYADVIRGYWRDNGAKFPRDIRELRLVASDLAMPIDMMEVAQQEKAKANGTRKSKEKIVDEVLDEAL